MLKGSLWVKRYKIIFLLSFFFISCSQKYNSHLLTRNENGHEIPQDILFNGEFPTINTPHYFEKTTIKIFSENGKIASAIMLPHEKNRLEKGFLHCFSVKKPGIPLQIQSPDRVPNTDFDISFKIDTNSSACNGVSLSLSKNSKFILIDINNLFQKGVCQVELIVSTPDSLNRISRFISFTWDKKYSYWCGNNVSDNRL